MVPLIRWYRSLEGLGRRPSVDGDDVYVLVFDQYSREYQLKAFDRETGDSRWICRLSSGGYASLAVDSENVYTPLAFTRLGAVARKDGTLRWTHDFNSRLRSTPTLWNGHILIVTANRFIALSPRDGSIRREAVLHDHFLFGKVTVVHDFAYFLASSNPEGEGSHLKVVALNLTNFEVFWSASIGPGLVASSDTSGVAISPDLLFCGGVDGNLYALGLTDGSIKWKAATRSVAFRSAPTYANGKVYVGNMAGDLNAFDAQSGELLWHRPLNKEGFWCSPEVLGSSVLAHAGNDFYVLSADSGQMIGERPIGHAPYTGIEIANNEVYVCGGDPPDYAALFKLEIGSNHESCLSDVSVEFDPKAGRNELAVSVKVSLPSDETICSVTVDMRPLGGSQNELISPTGQGMYSFCRRVPVAKLLGQGALVMTIKSDLRTQYETVGFDLTSAKPIPSQHVIQNFHLSTQTEFDHSGPAVIQGLLARVGKEVDREEVYSKGDYIVERGLDPHHKWRSGAIRIFHSQAGEFAEAKGMDVSPDDLFTR